MWDRLITYGDSWTAGHGVETEIKYKEVIDCGILINNLRLMNGWPRYLAQYLDIPFSNLALCNKSNPEIVNDVKDTVNQLTSKDLIIVMLSYAYRGDGEPIKDVSELNNILKGKQYYIVNSFYPTFKEVPKSNTVDKTHFLLPDNTFAEFLINYEKQTGVSVWEYGFKKVNEQGSFLGGDFHPNTEGYKLIAWELYNRIKK